LGGGIAKRGAFHIELDAARHHLYLLFLQAGTRAMLAGSGAGKAGINAVLMGGVGSVVHNGADWECLQRKKIKPSGLSGKCRFRVNFAAAP
jgi:hypothetical protein